MKLAVRRLVLAVVPALAVGVAGCGMNEQTQRWYAADNGVNAEAGQIGLRNVLVVADDEGQATVIATFSNRSDQADELVEIVVGDAATEPVDGVVEIPAAGYASVGPDTNRVDVDGADIATGLTAQVEFRFAGAPRTTVEALVVANEGTYADALPAEPREEPADDEAADDEAADDAAPDDDAADDEATDDGAPDDGEQQREDTEQEPTGEPNS